MERKHKLMVVMNYLSSMKPLQSLFFCIKQKLFVVVFFLSIHSFAQQTFVATQKTFTRVDAAFKQKEDSLKKQFAKAKLNYPPQQMYLRSFKYDSELEVWIKENNKDSFSLFKTYKICALSGSLGPKRIEGDYQVPEGFYSINQFNPKSIYHLSLGINYPNTSDAILSDSVRPGGDIFIHGNCVTTGCIPIKDQYIEELYVLATQCINAGQDFIPIHIFPIRFNNVKSFRYLAQQSKDNVAYQKFALNMQEAFDYFNQHKKIPTVAVADNGDYVIFKN